MKRMWKTNLTDNVIGLAAVIAKHGNKFRKITGVSFKNSLIESSLAWSTLEKYMKKWGKSFYTPKKYV